MQLKISNSYRLMLVFSLLITIAWMVTAQENKKTLANKVNLQEAIKLYYQGDFDHSINLFATIVKTDPNAENARLNLARLLREAGRLEEALEHLDYLIKTHPTTSKYQSAYLTTAYLAGQNESILTAKLEEETAVDLFWKGLAYYDLKDYDHSHTLLVRSLEHSDFNPLANYFLGLINLEKNNFMKAKDYLTIALTQDPNLVAARYELARAYLGLEDYKSAYKRLKQAQTASPSNKKIQVELEKLLTAHPDLQEEEKKEEATSRLISSAPIVEPVDRTAVPQIRIGLAENVGLIFMKTSADFRLTSDSGVELLSGSPQTILKFVFSPEGRTKVYDEQEHLLLTSTDSLILSYLEPGATTLLFNLEFGRGYYWAGYENRAYRGEIHLLPFQSGLTIVNQLTIEEYLYSVVPSEMPSSWPAAALEAQAIAARTYAFSHLGSYQKRGFDLLSSVASQAYNGVKNETSSVVKAVNATKGQVLTFEGKPISAFYSANSGGYSTVPPETWRFTPPYLQAVPDKLLPAHNGLLSPEELATWVAERTPSYSSRSKYSSRSAYRWQVIVTREEIESRLNRQQLGEITGLITVGRADCGRVNQVLIKGTKDSLILKGDAIRSKLGGLRSNLFVVEPKLGKDGLPEFFVFTGGGFGHGVGMDQSGAAGMADDGFTVEEILNHYYPGTTLTNIY